MRPVIGITGYVEQAKWLAWDNEVVLAPMTDVDSVRVAGGRPLIVPPMIEGIDETLAAPDGIIFSGGSDIGPERYGAEPHPETQQVRAFRDEAELPLLERALARDIPTLA